MRKNIILIIMTAITLAVFSSMITWYFAYVSFQKAQEEAIVEEDPVEQVVVRATMISRDENGILVELDSDSSFDGMQVYIPDHDGYEYFHQDDYLDIYYNGKIIDQSPARFQKIYKIEKYSVLNDYEDNGWAVSNKDINDPLCSDIFKPLIQENVGENSIVSEEKILAEDTVGKDLIVVLCYVEYPNGQDSGYKFFYIQDQGDKYKIIRRADALPPVMQLDERGDSNE